MTIYDAFKKWLCGIQAISGECNFNGNTMTAIHVNSKNKKNKNLKIY